MEESKYYTPDIKEFRVGFECETNYCLFHSSRSDHQEFEKLIITEDNIVLILDSYIGDAYSSEFRVKYLDRQDIEELGFIFSGKSVDDWYKKEYSLRLESGHWFNSFRLQHDRNNTFQTVQDHCYNIKIYGCIAGCDDDVLFEGIIKNKSELKELLEKLGISYNS